MSIVSTTQLLAAEDRAKNLDRGIWSRGPLDYIPRQSRSADTLTLVKRSSFLSTGGPQPSAIELERIMGGNDLVDEFYFDRALLAAKPVCRIVIRSSSGHVRGYATGVMVSPRLLMTNEHVFGSAEEAAPSLAEFNYRLDIAGNPEPSYRFRLRPDLFFFNKKELDFSLVSVDSQSIDDGVQLSTFGYHRLLQTTGKVTLKEWMTVIQHPGGAPRQWAIRENQCVGDTDPDVIWYLSDTAPGSSGAPVFNDSFQMVALHHSGVARQDKDGKYFLKNGQMVDDLRDVDDSQVDWIANAGIRVSRICDCVNSEAKDMNGHLVELKAAYEGGDVLSNAYQNPTGGDEMNSRIFVKPAISGNRLILGTLVLELDSGALGAVSPSVRPASISVPTTSEDASGAAETQKEPIVDDDYSSRTGFNTKFLGISTPLPNVTDPSLVAPMTNRKKIIPYEHFSVVLHKTRKMAIFTASNVNGSPKAKRPEAGHKYTRKELTGLNDNEQEKWVIDPRVHEKYQISDKFYTRDNGAFDKGHIVRREDVCWGLSFSEVQRANGDTFHVTNCSPQRGNFNRSNKGGIWGNLENYIGAQADEEKYCIFAGPVLSDEDKYFSGTERVQIPDRFWKVVCAVSDGHLQVFAFILAQDLTDLPLEFQVDAEWKHEQKTLKEIEKIIGIVKFPPLYHRADQGK